MQLATAHVIDVVYVCGRSSTSPEKLVGLPNDSIGICTTGVLDGKLQLLLMSFVIGPHYIQPNGLSKWQA